MPMIIVLLAVYIDKMFIAPINNPNYILPFFSNSLKIKGKYRTFSRVFVIL